MTSIEGNGGYICFWFLYFSLSESCVPILKNKDLFIFQIYITCISSIQAFYYKTTSIKTNQQDSWLRSERKISFLVTE